MEPTVERKASEIKKGDVFTVASGPDRGKRVVALADAKMGRYSLYEVACRVLTPMMVTLDYKERVVVSEGVSHGDD